MKLCKFSMNTATTIVVILKHSIGLQAVAITKLMISGKKNINMIPMIVLILVGISLNMVRADNQLPHRQQQQQQQQRYQNNRQQYQQRSPPNVTKDVDYSAYYYECVKKYQ